jgi:hypothetical protein
VAHYAKRHSHLDCRWGIVASPSLGSAVFDAPFPSSSGLSDVGVLLSKELLIDDGGWVPNLVGSVGWTSPTSRGSAFSPIPYVSGFQAGLTASKRGLIRSLSSSVPHISRQHPATLH